MTGGSHRAGYVSLWGSLPIENINICQLLPAGGVTISEHSFSKGKPELSFQLNKTSTTQDRHIRHDCKGWHDSTLKLRAVEAAPMATFWDSQINVTTSFKEKNHPVRS